jgi:NADH-quinone oxidoreductase subunit F
VMGSYGKVDFLECVMASLGEPDETGRRRPIAVPGSEYKMPVGAIIAAIGQKPDIRSFPGLGELELTRKETIQVGLHSRQTNIPDVFAGGDAVTGPATVVQAIGAGKQAARAIHAHLRGQSLPQQILLRPRDMVAPAIMDYHEKSFIQRQEIPIIDLDRRMHTFDQVELGLDEIAARQEAKRCMRCDICERCGKCVEVCRDKLGVSAIKFHHAGESSLILKDYVHGLPMCIGCGSCVNICPTGALQMQDQGDERLLLMCGTIVNRIQMQECTGCGVHFAPKVLLEHVEKLVAAPGYKPFENLCPECRRVAHAYKVSGQEPDFTDARFAHAKSVE